ncbi:MAG: VWA domain-containing protein [Verrucomicrobiales bacterium]|nr:VWA domain-containing protein [Verrucomicrobiales bacterium]
MRFLHPEFLFLLGLIPLLALWRGKRGAAGAVRYSSVEALKAIGVAKRSKGGRMMAALRFLGLAALVVALARPQLGNERTEVQTSGVDIVLALDVSSSMEAMDFELEGQRVNRLAAVKGVVAKFIEERPDDRIGLLAFAGRPYLVSPMTLDHEWLSLRLGDVELGGVEDGTAIGAATASAVNRLREQEAKSKILILLTDGMNNAGKVTPEVAAEAAKTLGVKIYTVGAGTRGEAPYPTTDVFGRRRMGMMKVDIDEETLTRVAEVTGGKYFRATDTQSLESIYEEINRLEKTERKVKQYAQYEELFAWALLPGLLVVGMELGLGATLFRRVP